MSLSRRSTRRMGNQDPLDVNPLLNASQYFLSHRNWEHCREYAVRAQESNPNHPGPAQLLAIAAILSACPSGDRHGPPDWYSILGLPRFTRDPKAIRARFESLDNLVNPEKNPYPFAVEARAWVLKAGSVLSNPNLKSQFDKDLRRKKRDAQNDGGTFWTACPYCYFMYEYERVFEDCVLRCQNENCKRAFTAVAVAASAVPPPEVVEMGKYVCGGFLPLVPSKAKNGPEEGWKWWEPFVSMGSGSGPGLVDKNAEELRTNEGWSKTKTEKCNNIIDITDEDDEMAGDEEIKKRGDVAGENGGKAVMKRKKMAAKGKKKVMGKGIRVECNPSLPREGGEGMELKVEGNRGGANTSGEIGGSGGVGLEFFSEADDIFVSLNTVTDLGFGHFGA